MNFEDLYETYSTDIYRFAFWLTGDRHQAEDITSETFIRAWTNRSNIRTETLKAYILTIARNIFLEQNRRKKPEVPLDEMVPDPAPGPDAQLESRLELLRIRAILRNLPEIDRTAFILRVFQDLSYAEIARVLELSLSALKVKVYRVRKTIMADLMGKEASRS
ncbi:RNA polymerase sigma factor [bacterium]|nr:RNA polymerase sigma factor [candidate division CSSED10-310 bacterium]